MLRSFITYMLLAFLPGFALLAGAPNDVCAQEFRDPFADQTPSGEKAGEANTETLNESGLTTPLDSIPDVGPVQSPAVEGQAPGVEGIGNEGIGNEGIGNRATESGDSAFDVFTSDQDEDPPRAFFPADEKLDLRPTATEPATASATPGSESTDDPMTDEAGIINGSIEQIEPGRIVRRPREFDEAGQGRGNPGIELVVQNYPDGKPMLKKEMTQDASGNYVNHGSWEVFNRLEQRQAKGQFKFGKMDGIWTRWHQAEEGGIFAEKPFSLFKGPYQSMASFDNGKLNGTWVIQDRTGRKIFEIQYKNGIRQGTATWLYPNQSKMRVATFLDGLLDGGLYEWDEKSELTREEEYDTGRRVIRQTTWYRPDFKSSENSYLDGTLEFDGDDNWWKAEPAAMRQTSDRVQNGPAQVWYPNRQPKMKGQYDEGKRVGRFIWWHENGLKQGDGTFDDGMKTGLWTWWHENGRKAIEGKFERDKEVGIWTWWNADGTVSATEDMDLRIESGENNASQFGNNETGANHLGNSETGDNSIFSESSNEPLIDISTGAGENSDSDDSTLFDIKNLIDNENSVDAANPHEDVNPVDQGDPVDAGDPVDQGDPVDEGNPEAEADQPPAIELPENAQPEINQNEQNTENTSVLEMPDEVSNMDEVEGIEGGILSTGGIPEDIPPGTIVPDGR